MLYSIGYLIAFGIAAFQNLVSARFCEGGHRCSPPKECCAQGCCYLYAPPSAPRATPPATDHVLNLFFINHWYFWCVVLALILAILCACSLWKKRRQLCGWGSPGTHSQSGDSAGSCYAPPQYSRCSSFHHAPPPYTEVTSKPDLYPLVFTCNGDNTKNGSSYLMVQYFRNYIVRPVGSLSATSTVDSLSSSFICTANEANTLVPPPYSRAASPDGSTTGTVPTAGAAVAATTTAVGSVTDLTEYGVLTTIPRSASQQGYSLENHAYRTVPIYSRDELNMSLPVCSAGSVNKNNNNNNNQMRMSESVNFQTFYLDNSESLNQVIMSQSDQQFKHIVSNVSVPFQNIMKLTKETVVHANDGIKNNQLNAHSQLSNISSNCNNNSGSGSVNNTNKNNNNNNNAVVVSNNNNNNNYNNNSNNTNTNLYNSSDAIYNSCGSIGGISITIPVNASCTDPNDQDLDILRRNLATCCQILQKQQIPCDSFSEESPINAEVARKFEGMRSYINSNTGSAVSSLANIGSPSSPPQATSPTGEVKELLEQILQLQHNTSTDLFDCHQKFTNSAHGPVMPATTASATTTSATTKSTFVDNSLIACDSLLAPQNTNSAPVQTPLSMRPSSLQSRKDIFIKSNKNRYFPIYTSTSKVLRSPIGAGYSSIIGKGRARKGLISRSAPTTPGTSLPPYFLEDDSPLLNEQDEDGEQNV